MPHPQPEQTEWHARTLRGTTAGYHAGPSESSGGTYISDCRGLPGTGPVCESDRHERLSRSRQLRIQEDRVKSGLGTRLGSSLQVRGFRDTWDKVCAIPARRHSRCAQRQPESLPPFEALPHIQSKPIPGCDIHSASPNLRCFANCAGFPEYTWKGGMSFSTTLPIDAIPCSPTSTPGPMRALAPTHAPRPMRMPLTIRLNAGSVQS